jgi:hypothetical protein
MEAVNKFFEDQKRVLFWRVKQVGTRWAKCIDVEDDYIKK